MLSVVIADSYGNSLPTSCHSASTMFSQSLYRSFGSQSLNCVQSNTAVLAHYTTHSGQYGIEVYGLFSELHVFFVVLVNFLLNLNSYFRSGSNL